MIEKRSKLSIRQQCQLLQIHKSKLYFKPKGESSYNEYLMKLIDKQYQRTPFYGVPRMARYLSEFTGKPVNPKRVARLYKVMEIRALGPNPYTSRSDRSKKKYPYLLKGLNILRSNQAWAADITYIPMRIGFMYLFGIIDLHSRLIINWGLSNSMHAEWCCSIIEEAFVLYQTPEIFNTDQGSQFTSDEYRELMTAHKVKISMDGKGRAIDNIFIERFWRTIKYEYVYLNPPNGGVELYQGIEEYIRFYNFERPHSAIDHSTPGERYFGKKIDFYSTKYSTSLV